MTKTEAAIEAEKIAAKIAADKAARLEGRICACEGPHLATCTAS